MIDARLAEQETDGWRYHDMPEDGRPGGTSLRCLDEDAQEPVRPRLRAAARAEHQATLVQAVQDRAATSGTA